jgi:hypothetical protein
MRATQQLQHLNQSLWLVNIMFEPALEDLSQAADLFRPVHDATGEPFY